jgi:hypothetical protein
MTFLRLLAVHLRNFLSACRALFQPTLVRRLVLVLLFAFGVVFVVLIGVAYRQIRDTAVIEKDTRIVSHNIRTYAKQ